MNTKSIGIIASGILYLIGITVTIGSIDIIPFPDRYVSKAGISGSAFGKVVVVGDRKIAEIEKYFTFCDDGASPRKDPPQDLYFWKEGESPKLVTSEFTGSYFQNLGIIGMEDAGVYYWRTGDGDLYICELTVEHSLYLSIRYSRWSWFSCLEGEDVLYPLWFNSSLIGWNFSKKKYWPWVYQEREGWLYILLSEEGAWLYHANSGIFYYVFSHIPFRAYSQNGNVLDL